MLPRVLLREVKARDSRRWKREVARRCNTGRLEVTLAIYDEYERHSLCHGYRRYERPRQRCAVSIHSPNRQPASRAKRQSTPSSNQAKSTNWCDRSQSPEPLRVKGEQIDASTEHGHSRGEEDRRRLVLWSYGCSKEKNARVDQLNLESDLYQILQQ